MLVYFYLILTIIFFSIPIIFILYRLAYLNKYPEKYDALYDGHEKSLDIFFKFIRLQIKNIYNIFKIIYQNILHIWVQIISKLNSVLEKVYMMSRDRFMHEVVKDKRAVPYFWSHLKKYKREIDEEKEEKEERKDFINNQE